MVQIIVKKTLFLKVIIIPPICLLDVLFDCFTGSNACTLYPKPALADNRQLYTPAHRNDTNIG